MARLASAWIGPWCAAAVSLLLAAADPAPPAALSQPGAPAATGYAQLARLTTASTDPDFGLATALDGPTIVVGSRDAAYVFTRPDTGWADATPTATLTLPRDDTPARIGVLASDGSGVAVAIDGGTIVVGVPQAGAVYVFVEPSGGWTDAAPTAVLATELPSFGRLGESVAIDGGVVVAGAPGVSAAYVFVRPEHGWSDTAPVTRLDSSGSDGPDRFGTSVAMDDGLVAVGAPGPCAQTPALARQATCPGSVILFQAPAGGWDQGAPVALELTPPDPVAGERFGASVAVEGGTVVSGAPGRGMVYRFPPGTEVLTGQVGEGVGESVAISGDTVVAGAAGGPYVVHSGAVGRLGGDPHGGAVAVDAGTIVAGAAGAAYVFGERFEPRLSVNPGVTRPGEVVTLLGDGFPPSAPVEVSIVLADGQRRRFTHPATADGELLLPVVVFPHSAAGGAAIEAAVTGTRLKVKVFLLVQTGTQGPPGFVARR